MKTAASFMLLAVILVLCSAQVFADDAPHLYVGVDMGSTRFSGDGPAADSLFIAGQRFKDTENNYGLHVGFQFNAWFAAELGFTDFGTGTDTFELRRGIFFIVKPNDTQSLAAKGLSLAGVFSYPVAQDFSVFGVLGISTMDYKEVMSGGFSEATGSLLSKHAYSDQGLIYGLGAKYALSDKWNLRADLRRNDVGHFTLGDLTVGAEYSF